MIYQRIVERCERCKQCLKRPGHSIRCETCKRCERCTRSKVWWVGFVWKGQRIERSTKQTNKRKAAQAETRLRSNLAEGKPIDEGNQVSSFKAAMSEFLRWAKSNYTEHPRTYQRYVTSSGALLRFFRDRKLQSITVKDVERFKNARAKERKRYKVSRKRAAGLKRRPAPKPKTIRPATVNRELACLKVLFNYFIATSHPSLTNPVKGGTGGVKFLDEDNEQNRIVSYEEEGIYLSCCSQPLRDVAALIIQTGMRPEEVYRIRLENISLNGKVSSLFNPFGKTKAAKRRVPLNSIALEVIMRRISEVSGKSEFLFPSPADPSKPVLKLNNAHYGALKRSGLKPFRLYDLRHTWATRMAQSGIDLVTLATMLGHSEKGGLRMVRRYVHPTERHQFAAARTLEEFNRVQVLREAERQSISATVN